MAFRRENILRPFDRFEFQRGRKRC
jgi:hypothetical protein